MKPVTSLLVIPMLLIGAAAAGEAPPGRPTTTNAAGAAPRAGLDLARLKQLDDPKSSAEHKARLGLRFYRDEMVNPTPRPAPPYTDPRTHDYVLAQITRKLASSGADTETLKKSWATSNPGEVKDSLAIFLALKGKTDSQDAVEALVVNRAVGMRLREAGVEALGRLALRNDDGSIGRVLAQVVREDTQPQYEAGVGHGPKKVLFPVRKAAVEAIRGMVKKGMLLDSYVTAAVEHAQVELELPAAPKAAPGKPAPVGKPAPK